MMSAPHHKITLTALRLFGILWLLQKISIICQRTLKYHQIFSWKVELSKIYFYGIKIFNAFLRLKEVWNFIANFYRIFVKFCVALRSVWSLSQTTTNINLFSAQPHKWFTILLKRSGDSSFYRKFFFFVVIENFSYPFRSLKKKNE